jgi:hypothetical protein
MENLVVNVYDNDLIWKAQIEGIESFVHRTSWHEIAYSEMRISKKAQGLKELQIGDILVINNDRTKALIVEELHTSLQENYWTLNLLQLKGMLNYRIAHPTDSAGGATWIDRNQSQVMTWLCKDNLVSQTRDTDRYFWNNAKTKNMLTIPATAKTLGAIITYKVDWKTGYIGDAIVSVAKMYAAGSYPIGWNVYITAAFDAYFMDTYQGVDRTIHQTAVPPVVFSEEYGNIKDANYTYSIKDWRNVVYMNWNNGTADQNTPVGNTTHGATISFNRKELIVDSSKKTSGEVVNEGRSELNKRPHIESFTAEIINNENTMSTYGEHWNLGDIVTVQAKMFENTLISIDAQVTEIEEIYDGGEYSINATFGEGKLSLVQLIKNAINQK